MVDPEANMPVGADFVRALGSVIRWVDAADAMVEKAETVRLLCFGLVAAMRPVRQVSGCIGRCWVVAGMFLTSLIGGHAGLLVSFLDVG